MINNFYHICDISYQSMNFKSSPFVFQEWAFSILSSKDSWVLSTDLHAHGKDDENDDEENSQTSADYCSNGVRGDWKTENDLSFTVNVNVCLYLRSVFTQLLWKICSWCSPKIKVWRGREIEEKILCLLPSFLFYFL